MPVSREAFGRTLRELRLERCMSQLDLATRSGLDATALSRLERGVRDPRFETLHLLAGGLGLPLSQLIRASELRESSLSRS